MKHLRYIRNNSLHYDEMPVLLAIPTLPFAVAFLAFFFTGALLMDGMRLIRLKHLLYLRERSRLRYIKNILISLEQPINREMVLKLKAA